MRRRGFTLIEVVTAITLTAIVLAIAAAALSAATTARERVSAHQQTLESEARMQALLTDMLRHAPAVGRASEPLLRIERAGATNVRLVFLSTGVREPFGTGAPWRVTVAADRNGLTLNAEPLDRAGATDPSQPPLYARVPNLQAMDVRVRDVERAGETIAWRTDWPDALSRPAMVLLLFENAIAGGVHARMAVALDPLAVVR